MQVSAWLAQEVEHRTRLRAKALTYAPVDTKALLVELRELERERLAA
jgi:hypothetical protein